MSLKEKLMELELRRKGWYKENGVWKPGYRAIEAMEYEKHKEKFMKEAAKRRGIERARKEAKEWEKRPTFFEQVNTLIKTREKQKHKPPKFNVSKSDDILSGGIDFNVAPIVEKKKLKIRRLL